MQDVRESYHPFLRRLIDKSLLTADEASVIVHEWHKSKGLIEDLCSQMGFLSSRVCLEERAAYEGVSVAPLNEETIDTKRAHDLGLALCVKECLVPLLSPEGVFVVAAKNPGNVDLKDRLKKTYPHLIIRMDLALEADILHHVYRIFSREKAFFQAVVDLYKGGVQKDSARHKSDDSFYADTTQDTSDMATPFWHHVFELCIQRQVSDIHCEPLGYVVRLRYRLDGVFKNLVCFHKDHWPVMSGCLKVMSALDTTKTQLSQQGRFTYKSALGLRDCRVATHPTSEGERITIRLLGHAQKNLDELGYAKRHHQKLDALLAMPEGIVLVTGPTGSGKTTTLHALLAKKDPQALNMMSLEDPVEYSAPGVSQTDLTRVKDMDFAQGIASVLRQDVDVLCIGEIRHPEVAQMAFRAAMTGHQVFTSLHAPNALSTLDRLKELGVASLWMRDYLKGVIAQRLVRLLCTECKRPAKSMRVKRKLGHKQPFKLLHASEGGYPVKAPVLYEAVGCKACEGGGYKGRTVVAEILTASQIQKHLSAAEGGEEAMDKKSDIFHINTIEAEGRELLSEGKIDKAEYERVLGPCTFLECESSLKECA